MKLINVNTSEVKEVFLMKDKLAVVVFKDGTARYAELKGDSISLLVLSQVPLVSVEY